jgi:hypothetical protein
MEKTFYAGKMTPDEFYASINRWFAENKNIRVTNLYTSSKTEIGLLVNKAALTNITLIYDETATPTHYGIDYLEKFALMQISMQKMKEAWIASHPDFTYVCCSYSHSARGQTGSLLFNGIGANNRNQIWVIYKRPLASGNTPVSASTPAPSPAPAPKASAEVAPSAPTNPEADLSPAEENTVNFCPECGKKVTPGAKFCTGCGTKL